MFPLDQADANLRGLPASTPARLTWVAGGHDGDLSVDALLDDLRGWFGRYLDGGAATTDPAFSVLVPETPLVGRGGVRDPETRVAAAYPGRGAAPGERRLGLTGEAQTILAPPGGSPAALTNLPGGGGALAGRRQRGRVRARRAARSGGDLHHRAGQRPGGGDRQRSGRAGGHRQRGVGDPVRLAVGPRPGRREQRRTVGAGRCPARRCCRIGRSPRSSCPGSPRAGRTRVTVALPAVAHQVPVEHRLQVVVATTDQAYALPEQSAVYTVALAGEPVLVLPEVTLEVLGRDDLNVPLPLIVAVSLLVWPRSSACSGCGDGTAPPTRTRAGRRPARRDRRGEDVRRRVPGGGRDLVPRRARPGGRAAGAERGRQDHGHPDAGRADPAGLRPDLRPRRAGARRRRRAGLGGRASSRVPASCPTSPAGRT